MAIIETGQGFTTYSGTDHRDSYTRVLPNGFALVETRDGFGGLEIKAEGPEGQVPVSSIPICAVPLDARTMYREGLAAER